MREPMLTLPEVAEVLSVSMTVAYGLVTSGELVAAQVGPKNIWRILPSELDDYIARAHDKARQARQAREAGRGTPRTAGPSADPRAPAG